MKLHCSCHFLKGSEGLPVPPTWFNYSDVRSQWELVKPLWLFFSRALHLSLPRQWHCPASHQLNYPWNILQHASSDDALYRERLSGCAFQLHMKIDRGVGGKKTLERLYMRPLSIFASFLSLISQLMVDCLLVCLVCFPLILQSRLVCRWSQLPWQQQGHNRLVESLLFML